MSQPPRMYALIPCAGHGSRAGTAQPKQYQPLAGQALVWHTLAALLDARLSFDRVLLVLSPDDTLFASLPVPPHVSTERLAVGQVGGASRAESVRNGLQALLEQGAQSKDWVLVHDAARCLITPEQVRQLIDACLPDTVGGLLALPVADTLKETAPDGKRVATTLPRTGKWLAQTPQMFRVGSLLQALESGLQAAPDAITDEASAIERQGHAPLLVPGSAWNFKVTYPEDFALADMVLRTRQGHH
ncbi:MAG: 2-C-methyl-D-erythritol 4-phosphate cytidylyltransferase [Brachymonas sp.]|nr:2-C-methyl-D-erythritol 4-phosphate cytidylyltransferase [Brachymonas sp.]